MTAIVYALPRVGARQSAPMALKAAKRLAFTPSWHAYRGDLTGTRTC